MPLPKGEAKEAMIREGVVARRKREAKEKAQAKAEALKAEEEAALKHRDEVNKLKKFIEGSIERKVRTGHRRVEIEISECRAGQDWQTAVKELQDENQEYSFELKKKTFFCDNHFEAANVDYVTPKSWTEQGLELVVTW